MSDYRTNGVFYINKWIWTKLIAFEVVEDEPVFSSYTTGELAGIVPIIPGRQIEEFNNLPGSPPFIVYTFSTSVNPNHDWWVNSEQVRYTVYGSDDLLVQATQNYLTDLLRREDWTAADINVVADGGFNFKCVYLVSSSGLMAPISEGGRYYSAVSARFDYTKTMDSHGLRA